MTTTADPAPTPADPSPSDYAELWRAIGRLAGTLNSLVTGQRELRDGQEQLRAELRSSQQELRAEIQAGQQELRAEIQAGLREVNPRVDRLFYTILAFGGAMIVAVFASRFVGG